MKTITGRAVRLAAAGILATTPLAAQQGNAIRVDYEQFQLDNGLTVILHRDTTTPTIATNIWYHVGSSSEIAGRTGFAHLFEHIMFEGSANVPEGAIDEWFEEVGGSPNGSTSRDRTNYMQSFGSNALDLALFIESDRMGYLLEAMGPASVDGQRDVVKNERRQSYDNRPYGLASQLITETLYPATHPYSWPVIGYMDHLSAAAYDDVVAFFRQYYTPGNATLTIAGDIDLVEARRLAAKWFGELPAGPVVAEAAATAPAITEPQRIMLEDRVQLPRLYLAWASPARYAPDDAELAVLAGVLADGKNSRLYRRLVYELQIADDVTASQSGGRLGGEFQIMATARAGTSLEQLERVILEEIEAVIADGPLAAEMQRVLNQRETSFLEGLETVSAKADKLNEYLYYTGTPDYFNEDLNRFRAMQPAGVSSAARRFLDRERRVVLSIVPRDRQDLAVPGSRLIPREKLDISPEARRQAMN